jgi:rhodanese-related sulfurtransferase
MMKKGVPGLLLSPFGITQIIMLAAVGTALWLAYDPWRWERLKDEVRRRHPATPQIDAASLNEWMNRREGPKPVVIDVRPRAEFDFSHLPGARHMGLSDTPSTLGFADKNEASFVICDAIGLDSFAVAASLSQRGYLRIQALEGGIFEWANKGLPLDGPDGEMTKVKSGSSPHAGLLKRRLRAP